MRGISNRNICRFCERVDQKETLRHLLLDCVGLAKERMTHMAHLFKGHHLYVDEEWWNRLIEGERTSKVIAVTQFLWHIDYQKHTSPQEFRAEVNLVTPT